LLPALAEVTSPIAMVFGYEPAAAAAWLTVTVQVLFAGIVPPASCTVVPLFAAVSVPPQVVVTVVAVLSTPTGWCR
jgi:hypothetical protein